MHRVSISVKCASSVISDNETVKATSLSIFVTNHSISALGNSSPLSLEEVLQVLEQLHLTSKVLGVVFDVPLVSTQILHDVLLLTELGVEELLVGFELSREALVRVANVLSFVGNTLLE